MDIEAVMAVRSREDAVRLLDEMVTDLRSGPSAWENRTLDDYLEALGRWVSDMDGFFMNYGIDAEQLSTWQMMAMMLSAARVYE